MGISILILIGGTIFLAIIGVPIAFSLGLATIGALISEGVTPLMVVPQRIWVSCDSFPIMAVFYFVMAGELMLHSGISKRIVNFVLFFLEKLRGSLAIVTVVACAFFGALSGSALATTAAIGGVMYPEMIKKENNYGEVFSSTLAGVSGTLGTMIPPSIPLILYASITNVSVSDLFIGVIVPGIIMTIMYILAAYIFIIRRGLGVNLQKTEREHKNVINFIKIFFNAFWALLMPVIVLGGIYAGIFTPTESAVIACVYSLIVGLFIYRTLKFNSIFDAFVKTCVITSTILLLVGTANLFGWVLTSFQVPKLVMALVTNMLDSKFAFLLVINILFLIAGMLMDTGVNILILIPLIYPIAKLFDVNLVHFGIISCVNLSMGMATPPFGTSLFVASNMSNVRIEPIYKEAILYCIFGSIGIFIITYVEPISTFLLK